METLIYGLFIAWNCDLSKNIPVCNRVRGRMRGEKIIAFHMLDDRNIPI